MTNERVLARLDEVSSEIKKQEDTTLDTALRLVDVARDSIALVSTPAEYKEARDKLLAIEDYFRMRRASLEACNALSRERIRIEFVIGKLLEEDGEIHRGGAPQETGRATLETKYGISRWQAMRYKKLGRLEDVQDLEQIFQDIEGRGGEISSAQVSGYITQFFGDEDERKSLHFSVFLGDALTNLDRARTSDTASTKMKQFLDWHYESLEKAYLKYN